jgi:hypothetical protein
MTELDKDLFDAALEAYWAAEGGTHKGVEAAIRAYMGPKLQELEELTYERNELLARTLDASH